MNPFSIFDFGFSIGRAKRKKLFCLVLGAMLPALCVSAESQQAGKVARIGVISDVPASLAPHYQKAFRHGLRELGYIQGQNIAIEHRLVEGRYEHVPQLVAELISLKTDVIDTSTNQVARRVKKVTTTIPIVMAHGTDPVGTGVVVSLARPAGNVTGLTSITSELFGKRLELLKEVVPRVSRVAVLYHADAPVTPRILKERDTEVAAQGLGVKLQPLEVRGPTPDLEAAFQAASRERVGALITSPDPLLGFHRKRILELTTQSRLPTIHASAPWTESGGLMSYGADNVDLYRRAAVYVDKILKGANPAELPVEQPIKFELVINLKTAKQIGLTIPPNVLARADKVIK